MLGVLAHGGQLLEPHDVWSAWNLDPTVVAGIALTVTAYVRGWRSPVDSSARRGAFAAGVAVLVVALLSPLEAMAGVLVSAHMVQHVLLLLVAAPLLAISAPGGAILRGLPGTVRRTAKVVRRNAGLDAERLRLLRSPTARWLLYVATLWVWHASVVYGAAVNNHLVHVVEHGTFLGTAFLVWSVILGPARVRVPRGMGLLGVATLSLQGVFLSALLTFASEPWYAAYLTPPAAWGLDAMTDQQLAGLVMWVPAGFIHLGIAVWLVVALLRESELDDDAATPITIEPRQSRVRSATLHHAEPTAVDGSCPGRHRSWS